MDIRHLRYFLTTAKEGQITRAAKKLNIAQPPLSYQLKQLEEELGAPLFERNSRSVELTKEGMLLYKRAEDILRRVEDTIVEIKETSEGLRGELSIGTVRSSGASYLPQRIFQIRQSFPHVTFKIMEGNPFQVVKLLESREIELAIVRLPIETELEVDSRSLLVEPYVFVIPKQWEASFPAKSVSLPEIKDVPLLMMERKARGGIHNSIMSEFKKCGITPNICCELTDATILFSLIQAGVGAAVLPWSASAITSSTDFKALDISDCSLQAETALLWSRNRPLSRIAQRFIESFA